MFQEMEENVEGSFLQGPTWLGLPRGKKKVKPLATSDKTD